MVEVLFSPTPLASPSEVVKIVKEWKLEEWEVGWGEIWLQIN